MVPHVEDVRASSGGTVGEGVSRPTTFSTLGSEDEHLGLTETPPLAPSPEGGEPFEDY